jgi:hypothetical protein
MWHADARAGEDVTEIDLATAEADATAIAPTASQLINERRAFS